MEGAFLQSCLWPSWAILKETLRVFWAVTFHVSVVLLFWLYIAKLYLCKHNIFSFFKCPGKSLDKFNAAILFSFWKPLLPLEHLNIWLVTSMFLSYWVFFWTLSNYFYALIIEALIGGKGTSNSFSLKDAKRCLFCSCSIRFLPLLGKKKMKT